MTKWNIRIAGGQTLRTAISEGNLNEVLDRLGDCYKEINLKAPGIIDEDELEDELENLEIIRQDIYDEDADEDYIGDTIDYMLSEFYDLCDNCGIWLEL